MTQKKIIIYAIIIAAGIAVAQAQEIDPRLEKVNPIHQQIVKTDTLALYKQFQAEMTKEIPVYLMCGNLRKGMPRNVFYVRGFQIGGKFYDSKKEPVPDYIVVFAVIGRQEEIKKKKP